MLQADRPRLVLASASQSRRALLTAAGLRFDVCPAEIDETAVKQDAQVHGLTPDAAALRLALRKAVSVGRDRPDAVVVGCDQILVCEEQWFDKPGSKAGLRAQLQRLAGRQHCLMTAVVCCVGDQPVWEHLAQPRLTMRAFTPAFLDAYVDADGDAVLGCVGGYRLEGPGIHLFDEIEGDHSAILGLPLLPLLAFLRRSDVLAD
jgi:septum formation protein